MNYHLKSLLNSSSPYTLLNTAEKKQFK